MNPALYSQWVFSHGQQQYNFRIIGIWGCGFAHRYQVNTYEVLADEKKTTQMLPAVRMMELINEGKIKPL